MEVKNVHAIRINKRDKELKDYLSQFPQEEQTNALRELIDYGISSLKNNYQMQQSIEDLQSSISDFKKEQDKKFEEILQLLKQNGTAQIPKQVHEETENENDSIDIDKARDSMQEALSMFMNM